MTDTAQEHNFKAVLENIRTQMNDFSSNHAGVLLDEDSHREEIVTIQTALRIADRVQRVDLSEEMVDIAYKRKDLCSGHEHCETFRKLTKQLFKECVDV